MPPGQLVTGFTATGDLVCTAINVISPPRFLGATAQSFSGELTFDDQSGWVGAGAACRSNYNSEPTARICTPADVDLILQRNDTSADVISNIHNRSVWALFHGTGGSLSDIDTDRNNCHNLSYDSGVTATGSVLLVAFDSAIGNGIAVDRATYRLGVGCNTQLPVLCCGGS